MAPSWIQIAIVVALLLVLFGRGRISDLMSEVGKGIRSFRKGISEDAPDTASQSVANAEQSEDSGKTTPEPEAKS